MPAAVVFRVDDSVPDVVLDPVSESELLVVVVVSTVPMFASVPVCVTLPASCTVPVFFTVPVLLTVPVFDPDPESWTVPVFVTVPVFADVPAFASVPVCVSVYESEPESVIFLAFVRYVSASTPVRPPCGVSEYRS